MNKKRKRAIQLSAVLAAVIFIVCGTYRGEAEIVRNKAVNICLECIGLG